MLFSKKVILDTNFLMIPGQFKVDIFEEIKRISDFNYKLFIFEQSLNELDKILKTGNTRDKTAARIAKILVKQKEINILPGEPDKNIDEQILEFATNNTCVIATLDAALLKRVRNANHKTIFILLRNKKYLTFLQ